LNKTVTAGSETITAQGFKYKKTSTSTWSTSDNGSLTGLTANTQYEFYAYATTASGTIEGSTRTFTTSAVPYVVPPTVTTLPATYITETSAILNKTVIVGDETIIEQGFNIKEKSASTWFTFVAAEERLDLIDFAANTEYEFYAYATTASGTVEGNTRTFRTLITTDIEKVQNPSISIFPNPTNNQITITSDQWDASDKVEIYNVNGGLVGVYDVSGGTSTTINIAHLSAGTYIVKMVNKAVKIVKP
jgi:hypothetical protein